MDLAESFDAIEKAHLKSVVCLHLSPTPDRQIWGTEHKRIIITGFLLEASFRRIVSLILYMVVCPCQNQTLFFPFQNGLATLRGSLTPVSGSMYSFQLTGYMGLPVSLVAMTTPSALLAVER